MSPEAKKKAAEAKSRGDDAFNTKDFQTAVDAYTQVGLWSLLSWFFLVDFFFFFFGFFFF